MIKELMYFIECCILPFGLVRQFFGLHSFSTVFLALAAGILIMLVMRGLNKIVGEKNKKRVHRFCYLIAIVPFCVTLFIIPFNNYYCTIGIDSVLYGIILALILRDGFIIKSDK